jgi:hypothetical protein
MFILKMEDKTKKLVVIKSLLSWDGALVQGTETAEPDCQRMIH